MNIVRGRGENPPTEFPLSTETAWLLGIYVAEGWNTLNHDVFFSLNHDEVDLRERIFAIAKSLGYSPQIKKRETATVVRFSSAIMARALREWCGHGAENKRIPDFILYHKDLELLQAFLKGYLQGDGSKITDKRGPDYIRADRRVREDYEERKRRATDFARQDCDDTRSLHDFDLGLQKKAL
jgi:hypothetical protein